MTGRRDLVAAAAFFGAGALILLALRTPPRVPVEDPLGPYGLPRAIGVGLVLVAVVLVAQAWWAAIHRPPPAPAVPAVPPGPAEPAVPADADADAELDPPAVPRRLGLLTIAAVVGFALVLPWLGFVVAGVLLGLVLLPLLGARRPHVVVGVPVAAVAVLWLLFVHTLDVGLPTFLGR